MPVRRPPTAATSIEPAVRYLLEHGEMHWPALAGGGVAYGMSHPSLQGRCHRYDAFSERWRAVRKELLAMWISEQPGTRPFAWWLIDAPRAGAGPQPRQHVGGSGRIATVGVYPETIVARAGAPCFEFVDPDDPPRIESEAAYLRRLSLLLPEESRALKRRDFEPELLTTEEASR